MKKATKFLLVASLACGIAGGACGIASLCAGFSVNEFHDVMEEADFPQGSVQAFLKAGTANFEEAYTDIDSLELDIGVAECTVYQGDTDEWRVIGRNLPLASQCRKQGGTLEVSCRKNFWSFDFGNPDAELEIWIPKSQTAKKIRIDAGVGDLNAASAALRCEKLDIDCGIGDCDVLVDAEERVEIDGGVGSVCLTLIGEEEDFNYDVDCGVGTVKLGEKKYSELGSDMKIDNDAKKDVRIECGVGDVTVRFEPRENAG